MLYGDLTHRAANHRPFKVRLFGVFKIRLPSEAGLESGTPTIVSISFDFPWHLRLWGSSQSKSTVCNQFGTSAHHSQAVILFSPRSMILNRSTSHYLVTPDNVESMIPWSVHLFWVCLAIYVYTLVEEGLSYAQYSTLAQHNRNINLFPASSSLNFVTINKFEPLQYGQLQPSFRLHQRFLLQAWMGSFYTYPKQDILP